MATRLTDLSGRPRPFEATGDAHQVSLKWTAWLEEFEAYADSIGLFISDDADDNKQQRRAMLLYVAGKQVRDSFKTLPDRGSEKEYGKAIAALNKHYVIRPNATFLRHKFRKMTQVPGETIAQFVTRLRTEVDGCDFSDADNQIRDQVVEKCTSDRLRRKFLEKGDKLTLQEMLKISATYEAVDDQAREMRDTTAVGEKNVARVTGGHRPRLGGNPKGECYRCGSANHYGKDPCCPARGKECRGCGGANHFERVCKSKKKKEERKQEAGRKHNEVGKEQHQQQPHQQRRRRRVRQLEQEEEESEQEYDSDYESEQVFMNTSSGKKNNVIPVSIGGVKTDVIIDSGCDTNIVCEKTWKQLTRDGAKCTTKRCNKKLYPYTSNIPLETVTCFDAVVQAGDREVDAEFVVIKEKGDTLLSSKTAVSLGVLKIGLNVQNVSTAETGDNSDIVNDFKPLFTGFGKLRGRQVKLTVNPDVKPKAQPMRRTPFGLREKVEGKIQELIDKDIIEPVEKPTPWVSPVVIVPKPNNDIRVCVDMREVNEAVMRERHPIPTIDELLQDMAGSKMFTKLDLKLGYHQLELHEDSRDITTFVTHCGLYRYKRLVMGINAASEIYQHEIQRVVQGIAGVANLSDDIIVHAPDREEHDKRLRQALKRLQEAGLTLNAEKCLFRKNEIEFLGHKLTAKGIDPARSKVEAVVNAREPQNASEVRSFLGLVNYCARFIPNFATLTEPLRRLTKKNQPFIFGPEQKTSFKSLKEALGNAKTLGYYDVKAKTQIITDASPVGIAGILVQIQDEGPRVISYASRSLSDVEKRYSQTEKEALAIVWACEKFHPYIYGLEFDLLTDHKPLQTIYGPRSKPSARIERWVLRLQAYKFRVIYIPGKSNIADSLSRLLQTTSSTTSSELAKEAEEHVHFVASNATPNAVTTKELEDASREDEELQEVRRCIDTGRWYQCNKMYAAINFELCTVGELVLRGSRIIIPKKLRPRILTLAHEGHLGIVGTKQNLRTKVWWPGMEKEAEKFCKTCYGCQLVSRPNPPEPVRSTKLPTGPWEDIALDFLGPLPSGHSILVIIDYYSRYYEIAIMKSTTAEKTVEMLKIVFARHGLPLTIKTDNGPQFISQVFADYMTNIGAKHLKVTPRWPQANGEVERQNQSLLKRMKIAQAEGKDWKQEILSYLMAYRATPHPSTGRSPAELLFGRKIKTKLPQINAAEFDDQDVQDRDAERKGASKLYADGKRHAGESDIVPGDTVLLRREQTGKLDTPFIPEPFQVMEKTGSQVTVESPAGARYFRNSSRVKKFIPREERRESRGNETTTPREGRGNETTTSEQRQADESADGCAENQLPTPAENPIPDRRAGEDPTPTAEHDLRRSTRNRQLPKRFEDFVMDRKP